MAEAAGAAPAAPAAPPINVSTGTPNSSAPGGAVAGAEPTPAATPPVAAPAVPAATPPAAPVADPVPDPGKGPTPVWTDGLNDDHKGYVGLKGFKDTNALVESYRNLESLNGVPSERILKLPEKADSPDWQMVHNKLGRPEKADGYKIEPSPGMPDEHVAWVQQLLYKTGLSKAQGEALITEWNAKSVESNTKAQEENDAKAVQELKALKTEWGAAFDQNERIAVRAAVQFNLSEEKVTSLKQVLGSTETMHLLHSIGEKIGEGDFVRGGKTSFDGVLTPEQAKVRIDQLKGDPEFTKRYLNNQADEKAEMDRLHKYANPESA